MRYYCIARSTLSVCQIFIWFGIRLWDRHVCKIRNQNLLTRIHTGTSFAVELPHLSDIPMLCCQNVCRAGGNPAASHLIIWIAVPSVSLLLPEHLRAIGYKGYAEGIIWALCFFYTTSNSFATIRMDIRENSPRRLTADRGRARLLGISLIRPPTTNVA
jgi:hypothetical protein